MKFTDLDYFQTKNGLIFIVRGNYHPLGKVLACPVYWPEKNGERISDSGDSYKKMIIEIADNHNLNFDFAEKNRNIPRSVFLIPEKEIVKVYKPRSIISKFKSEFRSGVWRDIFDQLVLCGITENDIGIFGSYLVGLDKTADGNLKKDIDFLIYGESNYWKLKKKIKSIIKNCRLSGISDKHIDYEAEKLGGLFDRNKNSFKKTLKNKWSSIQVSDGVLTTIRFVRKNSETKKSLFGCNPIIGEKKIFGVVTEDFETSFVPRVFNLFDGVENWRILTYFWVHHQMVKIGDVVEVCGNLHKNHHLISIDKYSQGIKII